MLDFKNDVSEIGGWLTKEECTFLYSKAKNVNPSNHIVEIGSWKGRSTICLAKGAEAGKGAKVVAIDPHTGSSEHQRLFDGPINTFNKFLQNIKGAKVKKHIKPIKKTSKKAEKKFDDKSKVGLLFIDGAHNFKLVKLDYKLWFPKVVNGGTIAFHDSWQLPGPHLVTAGLLFGSSKIKNPKLIGTITTFTKVKRNTFLDRIKNILFYFFRLFVGIFGYIKLKLKGSLIIKN